MTSLNQIAQQHHNRVINERIAAINNMQSKLHAATKQTVLFLISCKAKTQELVEFDEKIAETIDIMELELSAIKRDIGITRKCNHLYIQINPIVCENDLRRYYDFMFMSYVTISREITKFCQTINRVLTQLEREKAQFQIQQEKNPQEETDQNTKALKKPPKSHVLLNLMFIIFIRILCV